jgi:hypothetical protein
MPQSREHLSICDLLGIERGVVALTKADAVETDLLELAQLEVAEELERTCLANAPIVPVSALTGQALDELRAALEAGASGAADAATGRRGSRWTARSRWALARWCRHQRGAPDGARTWGLADGARLAAPDPPSVQVHQRRRELPGSCLRDLQGRGRGVPRGSVVATGSRRPARGEVELRLLPGAAAAAGARRAAPGRDVAPAHVAARPRGARPGVGSRAASGRPLVAVEATASCSRLATVRTQAGPGAAGASSTPRRGRRRRRADRAADLALAAAGDRAWLAARLARLARADARGTSRAALARGLAGVRSRPTTGSTPRSRSCGAASAVRAPHLFHRRLRRPAQVRARVPTPAGTTRFAPLSCRAGALEATRAAGARPTPRAPGDSGRALASRAPGGRPRARHARALARGSLRACQAAPRLRAPGAEEAGARVSSSSSSTRRRRAAQRDRLPARERRSTRPRTRSSPVRAASTPSR